MVECEENTEVAVDDIVKKLIEKELHKEMGEEEIEVQKERKRKREEGEKKKRAMEAKSMISFPIMHLRQWRRRC